MSDGSSLMEQLAMVRLECGMLTVHCALVSVVLPRSGSGRAWKPSDSACSESTKKTSVCAFSGRLKLKHSVSESDWSGTLSCMVQLAVLTE